MTGHLWCERLRESESGETHPCHLHALRCCARGRGAAWPCVGWPTCGAGPRCLLRIPAPHRQTWTSRRRMHIGSDRHTCWSGLRCASQRSEQPLREPTALAPSGLPPDRSQSLCPASGELLHHVHGGCQSWQLAPTPTSPPRAANCSGGACLDLAVVLTVSGDPLRAGPWRRAGLWIAFPRASRPRQQPYEIAMPAIPGVGNQRDSAIQAGCTTGQARAQRRPPVSRDCRPADSMQAFKEATSVA